MPHYYARRDILRAAGLGAAALALPAAPRKRPNFLFLFTDDQRFSTLNALNNPAVRTPNMDRMLRRGVTFTHAFTQGGLVGAICMPSRAQLMTGQTLFHVHASIVAPASVPDSEKRPFVTFPEGLRKAGYTTFGTGKWHNGPAIYNRSFSHGENIFFGGMSNHLKVPVNDYDPSGRYPKEKLRIGEKFSSVLFADSAIKFLNGRKGNHDPFLTYVAFTAPHDPRMAPKEYTDLYLPDKVELPKNFLPDHPFDNGDLRLRDEELAPHPRTPQIVREHIAAYYAMITEVDAEIGRVLNALEASGHADDTYVIFAADNGLAVGQHGLLGKQNCYDHSLRVPMVVSGPNIPQGAKCSSMCHLMDLCPTIFELSGVRVPTTVEARSLRPLLRDQKGKHRDSVVFAYRHFQRGIRTDRWKLVVFNVGGKRTTQLFDLVSDPLEMNNLAGDPAQAGRVGEMTAALKQQLKQAGDLQDFDAPEWTVYSQRDRTGDDD